MKTTLQSILAQPIPSQEVARHRKQDYRKHPLLVPNARMDEALVDVALYGVAGQSYYSRPNRMTGDAVPGVDPVILLRKSVAELLAAINHELQASDMIAELFDGPVELYVQEGMRSTAVQERLYEVLFPEFIAHKHPTWDQAAVLAERDRLIARPSSVDSASPHTTGAAFDITLRYAHPDGGYVPKSLISMGGQPGASKTTAPDYYELKDATSSIDVRAQRNRRIFYWVMRGVLLQDDSGLVCNPDEWWHWSHGDQLWAALTEAPCAYFDTTETQS